MIIFVELINKCLVWQKSTTGPQLYQLVQQALQGDSKVHVDIQAAIFGNWVVANFKVSMTTMTVHVFPRYTLCDQKWYMYRYLKKLQSMKVCVFTTRLTSLNHYLFSFPPDSPGQHVEKLAEHEVKELLFNTMPETWQKCMVEQGYNYFDDAVSVQNMADFFKFRCAHLKA